MHNWSFSIFAFFAVVGPSVFADHNLDGSQQCCVRGHPNKDNTFLNGNDRSLKVQREFDGRTQESRRETRSNGSENRAIQLRSDNRIERTTSIQRARVLNRIARERILSVKTDRYEPRSSRNQLLLERDVSRNTNDREELRDTVRKVLSAKTKLADESDEIRKVRASKRAGITSPDNRRVEESRETLAQHDRSSVLNRAREIRQNSRDRSMERRQIERSTDSMRGFESTSNNRIDSRNDDTRRVNLERRSSQRFETRDQFEETYQERARQYNNNIRELRKAPMQNVERVVRNRQNDDRSERGTSRDDRQNRNRQYDTRSERETREGSQIRNKQYDNRSERETSRADRQTRNRQYDTRSERETPRESSQSRDKQYDNRLERETLRDDRQTRNRQYDTRSEREATRKGSQIRDKQYYNRLERETSRADSQHRNRQYDTRSERESSLEGSQSRDREYDNHSERETSRDDRQYRNRQYDTRSERETTRKGNQIRDKQYDNRSEREASRSDSQSRNRQYDTRSERETPREGSQRRDKQYDNQTSRDNRQNRNRQYDTRSERDSRNSDRVANTFRATEERGRDRSSTRKVVRAEQERHSERIRTLSDKPAGYTATITQAFTSDLDIDIKTYWPAYAFYTLQGIYLCSLLFQTFGKNSNPKKNTGEFWRSSDLIKVD